MGLDFKNHHITVYYSIPYSACLEHLTDETLAVNFDENREMYNMVNFTLKLVKKQSFYDMIMLRNIKNMSYKEYKEIFDCSYSKYIRIKPCV